MNLFTKLFVFSCVIVYVSAAALSNDIYPGNIIIDDDGINSDNVKEDSHLEVPRPRRFSCDLFSFESQWVTPNDSVCALRCIATGRRGGNCKDGTCHCHGSWFSG